jgi:hypothetical protein
MLGGNRAPNRRFGEKSTEVWGRVEPWSENRRVVSGGESWRARFGSLKAMTSLGAQRPRTHSLTNQSSKAKSVDAHARTSSSGRKNDKVERNRRGASKKSSAEL